MYFQASPIRLRAVPEEAQFFNLENTLVKIWVELHFYAEKSSDKKIHVTHRKRKTPTMLFFYALIVSL